jgi:hypothetical protein
MNISELHRFYLTADLRSKTCSRVLISQGWHEIYITLAQYQSEYLEYPQGKPATKEAFLHMWLFGPYRTNIPEEMRDFGSQITELLTYASKSALETFKRALRDQSRDSFDGPESPQGVGVFDDVEELEQPLQTLAVGDMR